jgi:hypothetical protein
MNSRDNGRPAAREPRDAGAFISPTQQLGLVVVLIAFFAYLLIRLH